MTIREKVDRIKAMQERLRQEWQILQNECTHENFTGKYGANTGNWCEQDDTYWITCKCPDCEKNWTVYDEEDKEEYRRLSRTGRVKNDWR